MGQRRPAIRTAKAVTGSSQPTGARPQRRSPSGGKARELPGGADLDLERRITYRFSVISNMIVRTVARMYGPKYRLVPANWKAMAAIGRYGPMSAKDVCGRTTVEPDKVTRAVDRLVALGYVQRSRDPHDKRRVVLLLTRGGRKVYEDVEAATRRIELLLLSGLTARERRELERITTKLQTRAETHLRGDPARGRAVRGGTQ